MEEIEILLQGRNVIKMELKLAKKKLFEGFEIECYEDVTRDNGDFFMTRKQIATALEYGNERSFHMVVERKKDKIGNPVVNKLLSADGKYYNTELYSFEQFFELIDGNRQPKAQLFRKWAIITLQELITGRAELKFKKVEDKNAYEEKIELMINKMDKMEENLQHKIINLQNEFDKRFKIHKNESSMFSNLLLQYCSKVHNIGIDGSKPYSLFYRAIEDWFGVNLPSSEWLKIHHYKNPKSYILQTIGIENLEVFINGILSDRIVKSKKGHWVDLSGVYQNEVEFKKVLQEFGYSCAYCGESFDNLNIEHIIHQSNIKSTDMIYNIVPACDNCNKSKYDYGIDEWYQKQKIFSEDRYKQIKTHWSKYKIA